MAPGPRITFVAALLAIGAAALTPQADGRASEAMAGPDDSIATVRLLDAPAAIQLAERSSGALMFEGRMGTAQVAHLALDVDLGTTMDSYRAGDVAYWASGETVVIFLTDGTAVPPEGLVPIGQVTDGLTRLTGCVSGCTVRLDAVRLTLDETAG